MKPVESGDRALETARKDFEDWAEEHAAFLDLTLCKRPTHCMAPPGDHYDDLTTRTAFRAWQDRAALIQSAMNAQEREHRKLLNRLKTWQLANEYERDILQQIVAEAEREEGR